MPGKSPRFEMAAVAARVAERVPSLLAYVDADLRYVYANPAYRCWFGVADGKLVGRPVREVLGDRLFGLNEASFRQALEGSPQHVERLLTSAKTRSERYFSVAYLPDLQAGVVRGVVVEANDVTELKDAERHHRDEAAARSRASELLVRREAALEEAQRLGQLGSWEWEINPDIVTWSEQMYRMFGQDPLKLPPAFDEHEELLLPESWERLNLAVKMCSAQGTPYCMEIGFMRTDGILKWAEVRGEAMRDGSNAIIGLRGTAQDITDRRNAEQYSKVRYVTAVHHSVGKLLASLSEMVRQFLGGAVGCARLMKRPSVHPAQRDRWLDHIVESGEKLGEAFSETKLNSLRDQHIDAALQRVTEDPQYVDSALPVSSAYVSPQRPKGD